MEPTLERQLLREPFMNEGDEATRAMHHAAVDAIHYIYQYGWKDYVDEMIDGEDSNG